MRKKIICFILVAVMVVLTACGNVDAENKTKYIQDYNSKFKIFVDKETGINYIIFDGIYAGGMTVRLNKDGTPYVSEVNND